MVNARGLLKDIQSRLAASGIEDAPFEADQLFRHVTGRSARLFTSADALDDDAAKRLYTLCEKRATRYPLQYLLGQWDFLDLTVKIGDGVLIPRADTESVCLAAIEKCKTLAHKTPLRVVDLCSGSGAIALGIKAALPDAEVKAVELSPQAIHYLKENCGTNIQIVKADVFEWQAQIADASIDVLTANPPYIRADEMPALAPELAFEPQMALTDGGDGLAFYRHITAAYYPKLCCGGYMVLEIGAAQGKAVTALCRAAGYGEVTLLQDDAGHDRIVIAKRTDGASI